MFRRLFQVPKADHARDCVTTDGVSASWHLTRAKRVTMNNTKRVSKCKAIRTQTSPLVNGQFGNHGVDIHIKPQNDLHIIAGHANIISAVRVYPGPLKPNGDGGNGGCQKERRRLAPH